MDLFRLETESWVSAGLRTQKLDMSKNLKSLMFELDLQYDTDAGLTRLRDGHGAQLINYLQIRAGAKIPFKCYGTDIHILHELFNKAAHGWTAVTTSTSQSDQTVENKFKMPVNLPNAVFPKAVMEVNWNATTYLGAASGDYSVDSLTLNGTYVQSDLPIIPTKLIPVIETGIATIDYTDVPAEGRLAFMLVIARANASAFARRNFLTTVDVKLEDKFWNIDADNLLNEYQVFTGQAEQTGVYLLHIPEKPLIGNNSKITWNGDATSTDLNVYFGFVSPDQIAETEQPDVFGGVRQVVKGSTLARSVVDRTSAGAF